VLLIALWARSYWWAYVLGINSNNGFATHQGSLILNKPLAFMAKPSNGQRKQNKGNMSRLGVYYCPLDVFTLMPSRGGITVPIWGIAVTFAAFAAAPWIPRQFSLRTLLVATTLIAVALGLIVWVAS